jgi:regulator of sigma E protease
MMEFLQQPIDVLLLYALPFLAAMMLIVFVHEFGHYYIARLCGVNVESFSIGFGKELLGWTDKRGTRWKIAAIPLGGYVKFEGDANAASVPDYEHKPSPTSFPGKNVWQRMAIVAAGPIANFILGSLVFAAPLAFYGEHVADPIVGEVMQGSVADKAGLKVGDKIVSINDRSITAYSQLQSAVFDSGGSVLRFGIERGGKRIEITATPEIKVEDDKLGGKARIPRLGIKSSAKETDYRLVRHSIVDSLVMGTKQTWNVIVTTLKFMGKLFIGKEYFDQLRGPFGMAEAAGKVFQFGLLPFLSFIGLISVSIGLINLFPVPMLDGGHLVYYGIEALRGKPLNRVTQEWGYRIGFSVVMMFLLVATWNDLLRKIGIG